MYKITADGVVKWFHETEAQRLLMRRGDTADSAQAILKTMRGMGKDFHRGIEQDFSMGGSNLSKYDSTFDEEESAAGNVG